MSFLESVKSTWAAYKPRIIALAVGLALGPLLTNYFGYQVTTSTAQAQVRAGIVEQQALYCEARARVDVPGAGKLGWSERSDLAKKWAATAMPGAKPTAAAVYPEVENACAGKLAD